MTSSWSSFLSYLFFLKKDGKILLCNQRWPHPYMHLICVAQEGWLGILKSTTKHWNGSQEFWFFSCLCIRGPNKCKQITCVSVSESLHRWHEESSIHSPFTFGHLGWRCTEYIGVCACGRMSVWWCVLWRVQEGQSDTWTYVIMWLFIWYLFCCKVAYKNDMNGSFLSIGWISEPSRTLEYSWWKVSKQLEDQTLFIAMTRCRYLGDLYIFVNCDLLF